MQILKHADYKKAKNLFKKDMPNYPIAMSVFEGNNPGKIWVDDVSNPNVCLVITNAGYSYLASSIEISHELISACIALLKQKGKVKLMLTLDDPNISLFKQEGFQVIDRLSFRHPQLERGDCAQINAICQQLPDDLHVTLIDARLLKRSRWFDLLNSFYGSEENFLAHGFGVALMKDDDILSEAFACYIGSGMVETGSVTNDQYQGKGYATLIRAFLIRDVISRKLLPVSSCNLDNVASAKVSQKLGYVEAGRYCFMTLS